MVTLSVEAVPQQTPPKRVRKSVASPSPQVYEAENKQEIPQGVECISPGVTGTPGGSRNGTSHRREQDFIVIVLSLPERI